MVIKLNVHIQYKMLMLLQRFLWARGLLCTLATLSVISSREHAVSNVTQKLDNALGEHRPPWPRHIITPSIVLINQICRMYGLGERLTPKVSGLLPVPHSGHAVT